MKLEHFLTPYTKINSKWIKDLNIIPETIKLLEEKIGKTLSDINHSRILYDPPPRILEIKAKIGRSQDGGGLGRGEHFLPHKFIKKAFKRRVNSTKQLLNAGRGHQAPRKATQLFERR